MKKKIILIMSSLIFIAVISVSQETKEKIKDRKSRFQSNMIVQNNNSWIRTYGPVSNGNNWENFVGGIVNSPDGGYLVTFGAGPQPYMGANWILKLSDDGDITWQNMRTSPDKLDPVRIRDLVVSVDLNSYILIGMEIWQDTCQGLHISKMDLFGNFLFSKKYVRHTYYSPDGGMLRNLTPDSVSNTSDGGFIVSGMGTLYYWDIDRARYINFLTKFSNTGDLEWESIFEGISSSQWSTAQFYQSKAVLETVDKGFIVLTDTLRGGVGDSDLLLVKLDPAGNLLWQKTYGGNGKEDLFSMGRKIQLSPGGGYIITGTTESFGAGDSDIWVIEVDALGNILWQKTYGGTGDENSSSIIVVQDGYIITGSSNSFGGGDSDLLAFKISANGEIQWQRLVGTSIYEEGSRCIQTVSGGLLFAGKSFVKNDSSEYSLLIAKLTDEGLSGGGCSQILRDSDLIVSDTSVDSVIQDLVSVEPPYLEGSDSLFSQRIPSFLDTSHICWDLHGPPSDITVVEEVNQSLFSEENINTITWSRNPFNSKFALVEYRIFRHDFDSATDGFVFVGKVPVGTNMFMDIYFGSKKNYGYYVVSVDTNGVESPRGYEVNKGN